MLQGVLPDKYSLGWTPSKLIKFMKHPSISGLKDGEDMQKHYPNPSQPRPHLLPLVTLNPRRLAPRDKIVAQTLIAMRKGWI